MPRRWQAGCAGRPCWRLAAPDSLRPPPACPSRAQGLLPLYGQRRNYPLLLARGVLGSGAMLCLYAALQMLPLADAVTINMTRVPLVALLARLALGEPFPWHGWLALLACMGGVALVAHPPFLFGGHQHWGAARLQGVAADVASACFGAGAAHRLAPPMSSVTELRLCTCLPLTDALLDAPPQRSLSQSGSLAKRSRR
jgi:drug/metabolite transporter (DMT)-like permease